MPTPATILVVDDTTDILGLCTHILTGAGYTVRTAANGREAMDVLKAEPIDLVLLDIMMPAMDGLSTGEAIRANADTRRLPIVMMSAVANLHGLAPDVIRIASAVIAKPFDVDILLETVKRFVPA